MSRTTSDSCYSHLKQGGSSNVGPSVSVICHLGDPPDCLRYANAFVSSQFFIVIVNRVCCGKSQDEFFGLT